MSEKHNGRRPGPQDSLTGNEDFDVDLARARAAGEGDDDSDDEDDDVDFPDVTAGLEELMSKLEGYDALERELNETKTRLARLYADFENYRRRTSEDVLEARTRGEAGAVETLLPTYDDLSRAIDAGVKDPSALIPGLRSVRENFLKMLAGLGVEVVTGAGSHFDPNVHEAIGAVPGEEDDKVVEVYQQGFTLRGKLVRPARVLVSRK